jgi:hypothetical protein
MKTGTRCGPRFSFHAPADLGSAILRGSLTTVSSDSLARGNRVTDTVIETVDRHIRVCTPFEVYAKALQAFECRSAPGGWGGFYLNDRKEQEFELLSEQTGIPRAEIPNALRAFDVLFPPGPWIVASGPSEVRLVKMVPFCMRAIGSFQRVKRYSLASYSDLKYSDYTAADLQRWHNAGIAFWNQSRKGM